MQLEGCCPRLSLLLPSARLPTHADNLRHTAGAPMAFVSPKAVCYVSPDGKPSKGETVACEGNITITKISEEEVEIEWDITGCAGRRGDI